ncbi:MAG TPA: C4-dicarboxylate ABC transporter, partial [Dehalococcoidia bacterium]|nr:C4-dicarboxylate ABC transporter [Dehalococcoidia bacterium]
FIMASFLAVPYAEIALAAAIPAVLYYMGIFLQVDAHAAKTKLMGLKREELPEIKTTLKEGWPFIFAIAFLIYLLAIMKNEAQAPFTASAAMVLIAAIRKKDRLKKESLKKIFLDAGKTIAEIFGIIAGVGLVVGGLSISGVSLSFSSELVRVAGGNSLLILIAGAFTSFILGMGMTVSAVYVFLAIVMAPALVQQGFNPIAAHLFVIYWATVSYVTPPVALASYAASGIAKADPVKTSFVAMRLGVVAFIVPFMYVYNPALVGQGPIGEIISTFISASIGVFFLAAGFEGWLLGIGRIPKISSIILIPAGLLLMTPGTMTDLMGIALGAIVILYHIYRKRKIKIKIDIPESING